MFSFFVYILFTAVLCGDVVIEDGKYDNLIKVEQTERDGKTYLKVDWTALPNEAGLNYYRVNRSINDQAFQTISTMDLDEGDMVKVLNVYPIKGITSAAFKDVKGNVIAGVNHLSAGLKVYMEGGQVVYENGTAEEFEASGSLQIEGKPTQLIYVTPMTFDDFRKNASVIFNYDVAMFGSWDDFARSFGGGLNDEQVAVLEKYLDQGYGMLIGHDAISAGVGTGASFGKLAHRLGIKVGHYGDYGSSSVHYDVDAHFEYYSIWVKVSTEGRLTKYPHDLGSVGHLMQIPLAHTGSQWAHENVWFEFAQNPKDPASTYARSDSKTTLAEAQNKDTGNCIFYLTTKGNMAFIQTGHSSGKSSRDERMILANTLFYLKQKSNKKYVNDFDVYDVEPPLAPTLVEKISKPPISSTEEGKTLIKVRGTDIGSKFVYNIVGYNPVMAQIYKSGNITAVVTAGMKSFIYALNKNPTCTLAELTESVAATEVPAAEVLSSSSSLLSKASAKTAAMKVSDIVTENVKHGEATIEVIDHPEETYYLHVASVDYKDWKSKTITNIEITFPKHQTPAPTPTQSAVPPSPAPTQTPEQTQVPKTPEPIVTEKTTEEKQDPDSNNQNKGEGGKKDSNTSTIIGVVVGAVAAAAAVAGVVAAVTMCRPPIAIIPFFGSEEEEEEEEDFVELPANVIYGDEIMDPNSNETGNETDMDAYENNIH